MRIIKPSATIINPFQEYMTIEQYMECSVKHIEKIGRTCYKSEDGMTKESFEVFVRRLIDRGHEAMIEHAGFTVHFIVDRGVSHELVRHRIASFAQESTRYCNYNRDKFDKQITVVEPFYYKDKGGDKYNTWLSSMEVAEHYYMGLIKGGSTPQEARSVLPNSIKTEVMMTANFREWRSFFKLRAANSTGPAHPQMREVTVPLLRYLKEVCPIIFDDITVPEDV